MRKFGLSVVAAGLVGGAMLLSGTIPASATILSGSAFAVPGATNMIEQIGRHRGDRAWRYDSRRHGSRHRQARSGYRYQRDGYFYASPWWLAAPAFGLSVIVPQYSGHSHSVLQSLPLIQRGNRQLPRL